MKPRNASDAIERLEAWDGGHKRRSCSISHDDGYGSAIWEVTLYGVLGSPNGRVYAYEDSQPERHPQSETNTWRVCVWDYENDDWPGLAKIIHAAIDRAELLESQVSK